jgi:hypothetical protein
MEKRTPSVPSAPELNLSLVAGLVPVIPCEFARSLDARVEPAHERLLA